MLLLTADVGVPDQLRRGAAARAGSTSARCTGVIHAAGLPAGGMLQRRPWPRPRACSRPKVLAMGPLAELVGPGTPAGRTAGAAGAVLLGDHRRSAASARATTAPPTPSWTRTAPRWPPSRPSTRVLSVAWGPWQHDDWQVEPRPAGGLAERVAAYRARYGFADDGRLRAAGPDRGRRPRQRGGGAAAAARGDARLVRHARPGRPDRRGRGRAGRRAVPAPAAAHRVRRRRGPKRRPTMAEAVAAPTSASTGSACTTRSSTSAATRWSAWPWCSPLSRRLGRRDRRPRCCSNTRPSRSSPPPWTAKAARTAAYRNRSPPVRRGGSGGAAARSSNRK